MRERPSRISLLTSGLRVDVRMVFSRQLAVCALDLDLGRRPLDAENLVIVLLAHAFATFTMAGRRSLSPIM